jgi:hypothetical protein
MYKAPRAAAEFAGLGESRMELLDVRRRQLCQWDRAEVRDDVADRLSRVPVVRDRANFRSNDPQPPPDPLIGRLLLRVDRVFVDVDLARVLMWPVISRAPWWRGC